MNPLEIIVKVKNVYGVEKIYPVCPRAILFAKLKGQKTLTEDDIRIIRELGFTIVGLT